MTVTSKGHNKGLHSSSISCVHSTGKYLKCVTNKVAYTVTSNPNLGIALSTGNLF